MLVRQSTGECLVWRNDLELLQCGAGIAALVFRFSLKLQKSHFRSVGNSREWERDFREGEEM